uniref:Uncharacterized protein n=1 Tax=Rhizophora mucronata TaxID=61149 RepID=A0A2P2L4B8_RHIMU
MLFCLVLNFFSLLMYSVDSWMDAFMLFPYISLSKRSNNICEQAPFCPLVCQTTPSDSH